MILLDFIFPLQDVIYNEITLDGHSRYYVKNSKPSEYRNVEIFAGSKSGDTANAEIRNLVAKSVFGS